MALVLALAGCGGPRGESLEGADGPSARVLPVPASSDAYVPGQLVVGFDDADRAGLAQDAIEEMGFEVDQAILAAQDGAPAMVLVETGSAYSAGDGLEEASAMIARIPGISLVQPNYRYASTAARDAVADPAVAEQWYLDAAGISDAWSSLPAEPAKVDVAVLDTGMYSMTSYADGDVESANPANFHQEFDAGNLDIADGRDFVHAGDDPLPLVNAQNPTGDDNGHGTHVAGIIAAGSSLSGASGLGMAGVAPNARVIPCKVLDAAGEGDTANLIRAYDYLLNGGFSDLRVVNLSASLAFDDGEADGAEVADGALEPQVTIDEGEEPFEFVDGDEELDDEALRAAIQRAEDAGIVTVCAAGNEGSDALTYPGNYPECVCVAAQAENGQIAGFSNMNEHVDLLAPGVNMYSTWSGQADAYMRLDGTSQATAVVSGALAMMFAAKPGLTVAGAKGALYGTADAAAGGGHGALNAARAMESVLSDGNGDWDSSDDVEKWERALVAVGGDEPGDDPDDDGDDEGGSSSSSSSKAASSSAASSKSSSSKAASSSAASSKASSSGAAKAATGKASAPSVSTAKSGTASKAKVSLAKAKVTTAKTRYTYTGKALAPAVTVKLGGKTLKKGTDYTVSYAANKNPGTAQIVVKGKGAYNGTAKASFKIALGATYMTKVKKGKKSFTVTWKRQINGKVGYQVRYSLKKDMKGAKIKTVKKNTTKKLKVRKLKKGKRYYVQVRTYKTIGGKTYFSAWSAKKSVKVR